MFAERPLSPEVEAVRDEHVPDALVLDADADFETLPPAALDELADRTDELRPLSYPDGWLPADAPELLGRFASTDLVVGMPGDGSVVWTRQTVPPAVIVKARVAGSPESFVDFLVANALVECGLGEPEGFLGFFGEQYADLDASLPLGAAETYQVANALYDAYLGLSTRETFRTWADTHPGLHDAWVDAGDRIEPRVAELTGAVARGETTFPDAAELACAAVKHGVSLPAPFDALDVSAYRDHGPRYAVKWAEKTFESNE